MDDRMKGKAKEALGALSGDESRKEEGRAQQRKADANEETAQREKTSRAKKEAREAEKNRDRQKGRDEGLLGGVADSLTGGDKKRSS